MSTALKRGDRPGAGDLDEEYRARSVAAALPSWRSACSPTATRSLAARPGRRAGAVSTSPRPSFCTLWTLIGFPAITLPTGLSETGLPFGVQLAGPVRDDPTAAARRPLVWKRR